MAGNIFIEIEWDGHNLQDTRKQIEDLVIDDLTGVVGDQLHN